MGSIGSIWKFSVGVSVCAALIEMQSAASAANLLPNGCFEQGIAPWPFYINHGVGSFTQSTRTAPPNSRIASRRLRVTQSVGDLGVVQHGLAVSGGQKYSVTFYAKASSSGRQLMVSVSQGNSPWEQYYMQTFSLATSWQQYRFTFTPRASDAKAELVFASGPQTGSVSLDPVSLNALVVPAPALAVSSSALNFGSLAVGSSSAVQTLTMKNSGTANLVMPAVALDGDFKWGPATLTKCVMGASYAPGSSCTMAIYFAPESAGNLMRTLTMTNNADSSARVIAFSGTDVSVAPPPALVSARAPAPAPSPTGGLITNFTPTRYDQFQIDGVSYGVLTVDKSYSLQQIDNHTVRFEIQQGDSVWCCNNETAELKRLPKWNPATPVTIEYQFMLEPGAANTANWFVTAEMQSTYATTLGVSPAFAISLSGEHMFVEGRYSPPGGNPANGSPTLTYMSLWKQPTNIVRGQWYDIKIQANVINGSAGYLYVWINGAQVVNYHGMLGYGGDQNYWLYGLYRSTSPQDTAGQFRNMTVSP